MIKLKINTPMAGYKAGDTVNIESDKKGNPLDNFWFRRLKDAQVDGCVEIVKEQKESKKGNK